MYMHVYAKVHLHVCICKSAFADEPLLVTLCTTPLYYTSLLHLLQTAAAAGHAAGLDVPLPLPSPEKVMEIEKHLLRGQNKIKL